jgi:hypothetical protein
MMLFLLPYALPSLRNLTNCSHDLWMGNSVQDRMHASECLELGRAEPVRAGNSRKQG